jgi:ABC-type dipeptide/oligopeptide/nickel transport system permease subunit
MASEALDAPHETTWRASLARHTQVIVLRKLVRIPRAVFGLAVLAIVLFGAVLADQIAPFDTEDMDFSNLLSGMTADHWFGTDQLGRDTFSRLLHGSRVALSVSLGAIGLGVLIGVPLGLVSRRSAVRSAPSFSPSDSPTCRGSPASSAARACRYANRTMSPPRSQAA